VTRLVLSQTEGDAMRYTIANPAMRRKLTWRQLDSVPHNMTAVTGRIEIRPD
jgi:hypothetical protein